MTKSRTEQYFLSLFAVSSVAAAAEMAADLLRANSGFHTSALPVDVFKLAETKGLKIKQDLEGNGCSEGLLIPRKDDFLVRLKRDVATNRKRFSLAHELGHTFFYKDEGEGPRHAVGILDRTEHLAEERVCDEVAAFLLMPTGELKRRFDGLQEHQPSEILRAMDSSSEVFSVSREALARHAEAVSLAIPPCLVLQSSFRENPSGSEEKDLRTDWCAAIGSWEDRRRLWRHYRLSSIGLASACDLYHTWRDLSARGTYMFGSLGQLERDPKAPRVCTEAVTVSVSSGGKWKARTESFLTASRLYSWDKPDGTVEARVLSVLTPC
jgi:Zn-dependent peptidase ImmA (M78 family)